MRIRVIRESTVYENGHKERLLEQRLDVENISYMCTQEDQSNMSSLKVISQPPRKSTILETTKLSQLLRKIFTEQL